MPSDVDIVNLGLMKLGAQRISALTDNSKAARSANTIYQMERENELRAHQWNFAVTRALLPALTSTPPYGYQFAYQLPTDYLRLISAGYFSPGGQLAVFRGGTDDVEYRIEGQQILWSQTLNITQPPPSGATSLPIRYVRKIVDPNMFDRCFVQAFAMRLAMALAEDLTQQASKYADAKDAYKLAIMDAIRANAIENPPEDQPDGTWLRSRLPG